MDQARETTTTPPTTTLEYDRGQPATPMIALHYIALICALGPMIIGVVVFLLYVVTRHGDFALFGFMTILGGCAATFAGAVCLGVYWYQAGRANAEDAAVARRNAKRDAVLMLANFPLAAVLAGIGIFMMSQAASRAHVVVRNADTVLAERVTLDTGGDRVDLGPLPPGTSARARIKFGDAGLTATLVRGGASTPHQIFDHMDSDTIVTSQSVRLAIRNGRVEFDQ